MVDADLIENLPGDKAERYRALAEEARAVLDGETHPTSRMSTLVGLLHNAFDHFFWTGFYLVDPEKSDELVIGPYQGSLGCLRIPFGKGVCGVVAESGETLIVDDVEAFPNHIVCDVNSKSEIVIPVFDGSGELIAVLDVDSAQPSAFDEVDRQGLEHILSLLVIS